MIDLNRKPTKVAEQDEPLGVAILTLMPFAFGLAWMIVSAL